MAFSPDGKLLATADADGTVRLWNPASGQAPLASYTGNGAVNGVAFSPDGKLLATADADGTVRAVESGRRAGSPRDLYRRQRRRERGGVQPRRQAPGHRRRRRHRTAVEHRDRPGDGRFPGR